MTTRPRVLLEGQPGFVLARTKASETQGIAAVLRRPFVSGVWADVGCGDGVFAQVLSELMGERAVIVGMDRNPSGSVQPALVGRGVKRLPGGAGSPS